VKRTAACLAALFLALAAGAQEKPASDSPRKEPARSEPSRNEPGEGTPKRTPTEPPKAEQSVTQHSIAVGGARVDYTAIAGIFVVKNEKEEPVANFGYTAYLKRGADPSTRPITFAYNGGPGSSSVWLHMGALGPRRVVVTDAGFTPPPPYRVVDNAESIIDRTDLVMIDPVGTGFSRAAGEAKDKDFWGADPDIESVSNFIKQWVTENNRWSSPKYLLGESYGTTRSAGIVDRLQTREGMAFNGVILVSVALDLEAIFNSPGNDRPYPLFLPTYAAVAWYHKVLPNRPEKLEPFLEEVRAWAEGPYAAALMKGDTIPDAERDAVARKLHEYTGLSEEYVRRSNLRIDEAAFTQELLRDRGETVGRLDARFTGPTLDAIGRDAEYDPQSAAISAAYTAAFLDYYHRDLNFGKGKTYIITNYGLFPSWDFKHKAPGARFPSPFTNTGLDLAHALTVNPTLRVLVLNGYFDLATPFLATEEMMSHLLLAKDLRPHVEMKYYAAGHMMYVNEDALKAMKADVAAFMDRTMRVNR
jgi:carboxypeptidase C (cathepsin A)